MSHDHDPPTDPPRDAHSFGADRARTYDQNTAIALAGSTVAYELGASALTAMLDERHDASVLFVGVGTGAELVAFDRFDVPNWRFTGVDPSAAMIDVARERFRSSDVSSRTRFHVGELHTLEDSAPFDGAQMMGVLHHVDGDEARETLLREVAHRLAPGAPLVVGCRVGMDPVLVEIELRRWRTYGMAKDEQQRRRAMFGHMQPVRSDGALDEMLERAGFERARTIFVSIQYKVFVTRRRAQGSR